MRKIYTSAGVPEKTEEWKNGELHGVVHTYQDGEKNSEIPYVRGEKEGVEKRWKQKYSRGGEKTLIEEISWKQGKKNGATYLYGEKRTRVEWYYKGELVSKTEYQLREALTFRS